jgi:FixJ family two-component response regulator
VLVVPLTARERDIAALAAQGVTSPQIADQLYPSVRTVNNHLQSVAASSACRADGSWRTCSASVRTDDHPTGPTPLLVRGWRRVP